MINLLLIQPENHEIKRFRRFQFNNFSQLTIPYLAAFVDERYYEMTLIDEYCQNPPYDQRFRSQESGVRIMPWTPLMPTG